MAIMLVFIAHCGCPLVSSTVDETIRELHKEGALWSTIGALASACMGNETLAHLDQLIEGLEVSVKAFAVCDVRKDASLVLEEDNFTGIHYVLSGEGLAWQLTGQEFVLSPHTVIVVPPGTCLTVTCSRERQLVFSQPDCRPLPGGWDGATVGTGAPGLTLACGTVQATHMQAGGLFDNLRAPLIEDVQDEDAFQKPFLWLLEELATPKAGTRVLAEMLMKQCFITLLRRQCREGEHHIPWLATLDDPRLRDVMSEMLDHPEFAFTLQGLADIAGMSRASFAAHFKEVFGRTPMEALKEIRLRRAAQLLTATNLPVKIIAARVGFESRSYFSRAFKDYSGADPATFRTRANTPQFLQ